MLFLRYNMNRRPGLLLAVVMLVGVVTLWTNVRRTPSLVKSIRYLHDRCNVSQVSTGSQDAREAIVHKELLESVSRDVTWQESWPEVEGSTLTPEKMPPTVHYLWCGADRQFTFHHYLGVLSAIRILKPLRFVFHYTHSPPVLDKFRYNDWFEELNDTVPFLRLQQLHVNTSCGSREMLQSVLNAMSEDGGVFLGETTLLTQPAPPPGKTTVWTAAPANKSSSDVMPALMVVTSSFGSVSINVTDVLRQSSSAECTTVDVFNRLGGPGPLTQCVSLAVNKPLYPRDIWDAASPFAQLARWLFYGQRAPREVKRDVTRPIPRITHYIRIQSKQYPMYTEELSFAHFIGILSALHVAGFRHVYLHMSHELSGPWWQELRGENITVVRLHSSRSVFQQKVGWIKHVSDLSRYNIVYKYGGAYQDFDTVWTSYLPDSLLAYPALISEDISNNGLWPAGLSIGLFLARPRAPFLRHFLKTYKTYRRGKPLYNSIMMSYRTKERYPDTIRVDPHLQMICYGRFCYPHWLTPEVWDMWQDGGRNHSWTDAHVVHVPSPKPPTSFKSLDALKEGTDIIADMGRMVLRKSGRSRLLDEST